MEWQPIETAPKDGTEILLTDGAFTHCGRWYDKNNPKYPWKFLDFTYRWKDELNGWQDNKYGPTHWMPLPEPPK